MRETILKAMSVFFILIMTLTAVGTVIAQDQASDIDLNALGNGDLVDYAVTEVKIDGTSMNLQDQIDKPQGTVDPAYFTVTRTDEIEVSVRLQSWTNTSLRVSASIYDGDEETATEDEYVTMSDGQERVVKLPLSLTSLMDKGRGKLLVVVSGRNTLTTTYHYNIELGANTHDLTIKDVTVTPSNGVKAGRSAIVTVRLKNIGEKDEDSVKVTASVPELGVSDSVYIDSLKADASKSTEEMVLMMPSCAKPDTYTLKVTVDYRNDKSKETKDVPLEIIGGDLCGPKKDDAAAGSTAPEKTTVNVNMDSQVVTRGEGGAIYPIVMTNEGTTTKSYTLSLDGADWANVKLSPSNLVVLNAGETRAVYAYVSAKENAALGEHMFAVSIKSGDNLLKQVPLKADVIDSKSASTANTSDAKNVLEWVLVVLVVVLVIVGIVLLVQKMKGDKGDSADLTQTYY